APVETGGGRPHVVGLCDIPDIAFEFGVDPDEVDVWTSNLWEHARHGVDTVYWRVDGQACAFHTTIGTWDYPCPRVHSVFTPAGRQFGQFLARHDPLQLAVEEGKRLGLRIIGWTRTNSYSGSVVSRFFAEHPEWHEEREDGKPSPQLCFAFREVRAHKA